MIQKRRQNVRKRQRRKERGRVLNSRGRGGSDCETALNFAGVENTCHQLLRVDACRAKNQFNECWKGSAVMGEFLVVVLGGKSN